MHTRRFKSAVDPGPWSSQRDRRLRAGRRAAGARPTHRAGRVRCRLTARPSRAREHVTGQCKFPRRRLARRQTQAPAALVRQRPAGPAAQILVGRRGDLIARLARPLRLALLLVRRGAAAARVANNAFVTRPVGAARARLVGALARLAARERPLGVGVAVVVVERHAELALAVRLAPLARPVDRLGTLPLTHAGAALAWLFGAGLGRLVGALAGALARLAALGRLFVVVLGAIAPLAPLELAPLYEASRGREQQRAAHECVP